MKKTPNLFVRSANGRSILPEHNPAALWVLAGEGRATAKYDGTACLVRDGRLYRRYDAKRGKTPPPGFEPCQPDPDPITGHHPGWLIVGDEPESKHHLAAWHAWRATYPGPASDFEGAWELCGPKFQTNPHRFPEHRFIRHGGLTLEGVPTSFGDLADYLATLPYEGIVWHRDNAERDMVKIRRHDFDLPWPWPPATS